MSKIDELIKKLCPNGVKYEPLVNLCGTITTGRLNANEMVENGEYYEINILSADVIDNKDF